MKADLFSGMYLTVRRSDLGAGGKLRPGVSGSILLRNELSRVRDVLGVTGEIPGRCVRKADGAELPAGSAVSIREGRLAAGMRTVISARQFFDDVLRNKYGFGPGFSCERFFWTLYEEDRNKLIWTFLNANYRALYSSDRDPRNLLRALDERSTDLDVARQNLGPKGDPVRARVFGSLRSGDRVKLFTRLPDDDREDIFTLLSESARQSLVLALKMSGATDPILWLASRPGQYQSLAAAFLGGRSRF